ncbi:histidine kinase dimerization/phosphoacceptor domain -containing protein [Marinoscillum sp.]|uniref:histidine kinase dimerization/phosphoacceptor domain -containing protein n=1 Tax=Marinoscillum sp. TaxID=2024838 RepID=UPI003BAD7752
MGRTSQILFGFYLLINCHYGYAQVDTSWVDLPVLRGMPALVSRFPVSIEAKAIVKPKQGISLKKEVMQLEYTGQAPSKWKSVTFTPHQVNYGNSYPTQNELLYKDNAKINVRYLDQSHGFPENDLYDIAEGESGEMFFVGEHGFYIYNGHEAYEIGIDSTFFSELQACWKDQDGKIWIGGRDVLGYLQDSTFYSMDLPGIFVTEINQYSSGELAISTKTNALLLYEDGQVLSYEAAIESPWTTYSIKDPNGQIWIATERIHPVLQRNDSLFKIKNINQARSFELFDGKVWIATFYAGTYQYSEDGFFKIDLMQEAANHAGHNMASSEEALWIACYGYGVLKIDTAGIQRYYKYNEGLSGKGPIDVLVDQFGNTWVAHLGAGISRIEQPVFEVAEDHSQGFVSYMVSVDNDPWYFTNGQPFAQKIGDTFYQYSTDGDDDRFTFSGFVDGDSVWVSTYGNGLAIFQSLKESYHTLSYSDDYFNNTLFYPVRDNLGNVWSVSLSGHLLKYTNGQFFNYSEHPIFRGIDFQSTGTLRNGEVVFYSKESIVLIQNNQFRMIGSENGYPKEPITCVYRDMDGALWLYGAYNIYWINSSGVLQSIPKSSVIVRDVVQETDSSFYAVTDQGILSIKRTTNDQLDQFLYGVTYGLQMVNNTWIRQETESSYLVGGPNGVFRFQPSLIQNRKPPQISLSELTQYKPVYNQSERPKFIFNPIAWGRPATLEYRLFPQDSSPAGEWLTQTEHIVEFNNLSHGKYSLEVRVSDGVHTGLPMRIDFRVRPYWYEATWFYLLMVGLVIVLVWAGMKYTRMLDKKRARILEKVVADQTKELRHEKLQVQSRLEEKEVLLHEINHRVKNNLQIIASILDMQIENVKDPHIREVLKSSKGKVRTMAVVHQKLYENEHLERIRLDQYLSELCREILISFGEMAKNVDIQFKLDELDFTLDHAIPLGLIVNELVTNSVKYAFDEQQGEIVVQVFEHEGFFNMSYSDNGPGYSSSQLDEVNGSLGLRLIRILGRQIGAHVFFENKGGAHCLLMIPKK